MKGSVEINRGAKPTVGQSGVGFIVVPDDETRQDYIDTCYRTMTVTMNGGYGYGYISNVKILEEALQKIKFPLKSTERGTAVFWVRENFTNRPIIIGVVPDGDYTNLLNEGQGRYVQQVGERVVEIFEDATNGVLNISVVSDTEHPAKIRIKASSGNTESVLEVESDGMVRALGNQVEAIARQDFKIALKNLVDEELISFSGDAEKAEYKDQFNTQITFNEENVNLSTEIDVNITAKDSVVNLTSKEVNIKTDDKLNLDSGKEPMVLGDTLKGILNDLCSALQKMTVMTPVGPSSVPVNVSEFVTIQSKLQNILSKKSNLD